MNLQAEDGVTRTFQRDEISELYFRDNCFLQQWTKRLSWTQRNSCLEVLGCFSCWPKLWLMPSLWTTYFLITAFKDLLFAGDTKLESFAIRFLYINEIINKIVLCRLLYLPWLDTHTDNPVRTGLKGAPLYCGRSLAAHGICSMYGSPCIQRRLAKCRELPAKRRSVLCADKANQVITIQNPYYIHFSLGFVELKL
jgi:hypothetical protein